MEATEFTFSIPASATELQRARVRWEAWNARTSSKGDGPGYAATAAIAIGLAVTLILLQQGAWTLCITLPILGMIVSAQLGGIEESPPPHPNQIGSSLRLGFDAKSVTVDGTRFPYASLNEAFLRDANGSPALQLRTHHGERTLIVLPSTCEAKERDQMALYLQQGMGRAGSRRDVPKDLHGMVER